MSIPLGSPFDPLAPRLYIGSGNIIPIQVPEGARFLDTVMAGPGGNGGVGASGASGTNRGGGGGGACGAVQNVRIPLFTVPSTLYLFLPGPGQSGSSYLCTTIDAASTATRIISGAAGSPGANGSVGAAGAGGGIAGGSPSTPSYYGMTLNNNGWQNGTIGGLGNNQGGTILQPTGIVQGGAGGGGALNAGQLGGYVFTLGTSIANLFAGAAGGGAGPDGILWYAPILTFAGGAGGGSSDTGTGGNGGNGAPGCGAGGGGAGVTGGQGGKGGPGLAILTWGF